MLSENLCSDKSSKEFSKEVSKELDSEVMYRNTTKKFLELITEITDDRILLSSVCTYLKNKYSIDTIVYENIEQSRSILYGNRNSEECFQSFNKDIIMFGVKYELIFNLRKKEIKISDEYLEYLTTIFVFIIKNIIIKENEIAESKIKDVKNVLNKLSFTELTVVLKIFSENDCEEFTIIASNVAQKYDFTRSSIVNAIRKLESALIIESYSLGVKGTHIKIINNYFRKEINKLY